MLGTRLFFNASATALACLIGVCAARAQEFMIYDDACDASGAVALGTDSFLLSENNSNILRIYQFGQSTPVTERNLSGFLGVADDKETDIEASARVGDLVYFITSHGLNSDAEFREQRLRLFAQKVSDSQPDKIENFGNPYILLSQAMMENPKYKQHLEKVAAMGPEEGGINIEGLAEGPDGSLYAGFRSPAADGAIVMQLLEPREVLLAAPKLTTGEKMDERMERAKDARQMTLGDPIVWTTLEGRDIRSLEKIDSGYLIIAGPPGKGSDFKLFSWSGKVGEQPEKVVDRELTFAEELLVKPEAIFKRQNGKLYVLSDDGDLILRDAKKKCEKLGLGKRHFRGFELEAVP